MKAVLKKWWLLIAVLAVILTIFIPFMTGWRLGPGLSLQQVGTLLLTDLPDGTSVYIDNAFSRRAVGDSVISLLPGSHSIIVSLPGYQPWNEVVTIASGQTTEAAPLFVNTELVVRPIPAADQPAAKTRIATQKLPSAATPLMMEDGCVAVSVMGNRIIATASGAEGCAQPEYVCVDGTCGETVVFSSKEAVQTVIKYPGREDTLIVSVGQSLFVLEVDPREPQFFAPILKLPAPRASVWSDASIAVLSKDQVFEVPL